MGTMPRRKGMVIPKNSDDRRTHSAYARRVAAREKTQYLDDFSFHLRNALANWRGVLGFVSPPVGQALAAHGMAGDDRATLILNAELATVVVPERKFV